MTDSLRKSNPIHQTRGVYQGDNLSPLLFSIFVADLPEKLRGRVPDLRIIMYADDLVFYSEKRQDIQEALEALDDWSVATDLQVNTEKTVIMKFRRGGRLAAADVFHLGGQRLNIVNECTYLGVTFQTTAVFTKHINAKVAKTLKASYAIPNLSKLSLPTAM